MEFRIRKTSGKTWATMRDEDFIDDAFLKKIGDMLLEAIIFEAGKDFAKQGNSPTPRGAPEGIPKSMRFFDSFSYKIVGNSVEVHSSWPWIDQIIKGRRPYEMDWLRRDGSARSGAVPRVPMKGSTDTPLIRTTPGMGSDGRQQPSWIHPGFKKHNFIRRGYERARREMDDLLSKQVVKVLSGIPIA